MFCPKCGKGEQAPNAYCRNCGEWLPDVNNLSRRGFRVRQTPAKRLQVTGVLNILSVVFALIVAGALMLARRDNPDLPPAVHLAIGFSFAIAAWQIVNTIQIFQLLQEMKRRKSGSAPTNELNAPTNAANRELPAADTSQFVRPAASVAENTTELLEPAPIRRKTDRTV